jgi:aminopeptidase 2
MTIPTPKTEGREILPANVKPIRYVIELVPDIKAANCTGTVQIELETVENCNEISLNTADMNIMSAKITSKTSEFEAQDSEKIR